MVTQSGHKDLQHISTGAGCSEERGEGIFHPGGGTHTHTQGQPLTPSLLPPYRVWDVTSRVRAALCHPQPHGGDTGTRLPHRQPPQEGQTTAVTPSEQNPALQPSVGASKTLKPGWGKSYARCKCGLGRGVAGGSTDGGHSMGYLYVQYGIASVYRAAALTKAAWALSAARPRKGSPRPSHTTGPAGTASPGDGGGVRGARLGPGDEGPRAGE